ncbi:SDR family oxidoreductase [Candidatus Protochlamydia phocaeensis]|uniref:SDR family oxidoreductase n=1 Tax=Candidatus Protochlamydia phocaeensis TaxID=1414722 RepID=UPI0008387257|nr:SDR family oxidoreductase [Candidatus Protochlamydia phocaeensis]
MDTNKKAILLTGATGYIGGRLLKLLEKENNDLRCLVREPHNLAGRLDPRTRLVKGNVLDKDSLLGAMQGIEIAYYLVHSMGADKNFQEQDKQGAIYFAEAASACGVKKIIYLGGLGDSSRQPLSSHLESRQEVGECLRASAQGVQVLEFRASIVIGAGSLSFEMIRALCERLPILITPKWVWTLAQPISIQDVLVYLRKAIDIEMVGHQIFEIGGKDQVSYGGIMMGYIHQRGLHRWLVPVPVLTPRLSSLWLGLVTPLYARVGRKLIESAKYPTVVTDDRAERLFQVHPMGIKEAIALALEEEDRQLRETHWADALSSSGVQPVWSGVRFGNRIIDMRSIHTSASPEDAFTPIRRLGGKAGWYYGNILWRIRGFLDLLVGGVGLRRGRRDPNQLRVGDFLDFWRVEAIEPNHRLLLKAEMKLPGRAWLEFIVEPTSHGSLIRQSAIFDPVGLGGLLYWYVLYPIHHFIFIGMLKGIAKEAEKISLRGADKPKKSRWR